MTGQGTSPPDVSLPRLLQRATPPASATRTSLPTLRHRLTGSGPGLLLAAAAAGGLTATSALIGQFSLKISRMKSTPGLNHLLSHGIGAATTQYLAPDRAGRGGGDKDFVFLLVECSAECGILLWRASVGWRPGSAGSSSVAPASVSCHLPFNCDTFPKISNQEPSDSGSVTFRFHVQQENDNRQPRT